MRASPKRIITIMALTLCVAQGARADLFSPNRALYRIDTAFFAILFPAESRSAAEYLASFADSYAREVASLLGTTVGFRAFPVVITPDTEILNGYYTNYPYDRIVLFEAPIDPNGGLGNFDDDLRKLFLHELTHAISLTIRPLPNEIVARIFGPSASLSMLTTPLNFIEGVTVAFESRDGHGRASDPLAASMIRQDIVEGRFKTYWESAGAWNGYSPGGVYYIYGGFFSRWLIETRGDGKYAELWRRFGRGLVFRSVDDVLFVRGAFRDVYGSSLDDAWKAFREYMTPRAPLYMAPERLSGYGRIPAMDALGGYLYYVDADRGAAFSLDTATGKERRLFSADGTVSRLSARRGDDGSVRLLMSSSASDGQFDRLALREWNASSGRVERLAFSSLRDATASGNRVVAVEADGYVTNLVSYEGGVRTLLAGGSERVSFASPCISPDGKLVYALARTDGTMSVIRMAPDGSRVETRVETLVVPDGLRNIRHISIGDGGLLFSFAGEDGFQRLAVLDGETLSFDAVSVSGGIHGPVGAEGRIYYTGAFSRGQAPCAYPADRSPLSPRTERVSWVGADLPDPRDSVYSRLFAEPAARYAALPFMVPRLWYPTFRTGGPSGLSIYAAGAAVVMMDPAETCTVTLAAAWNWLAKGADLETIVRFEALAPSVTLTLRDDVGLAENAPLRVTGGSIDISWAETFFPRYTGYLGTVVSALFSGSGAPGADPYALPYASGSAGLSAYLGFGQWTSSRTSPGTEYGWRAETALDAETDPFAPASHARIGLRGTALHALPVLGIKFHVMAATALLGAGMYDTGTGYGSFWPALGELRVAGEPWIAGGEAGIAPLSASVGRKLGLVYFDRMTLRGGVRAAYGSGFDWSAFGRLELIWTPLLGVAASLHPMAFFEAYWLPQTDAWGVHFSLAGSF